ncbi:MAG: sel1 repeat family protein [Burkholderiales bacterium]|nr:sel1 repeat family protein [Burkholderiales bacterium]
MATRLAQRLIRDARSGDSEAQVNLGSLYLSGGEGLAASQEAALHWLLMAAREGCTDADRLIAESVANGRVKTQLKHCVGPCQRAANEGQPAGYCALGDIHASSNGTVVDLSKAQAAYRAAAEAGHIPAARKLGLLLAHELRSVTTRAGEEAAHWLRTAAVAGDALAAQGLAKLLWHNGDEAAAQWLEPDAQKGDPEAMYRLGDLLCRQPDAELSRRGADWLKRAVRKGHPQALWRYGRMHVKYLGNAPAGLPHSPLKASRLLERAAAAGVSEALWDLARVYEIPRFSRRDLGKAREYLEQAANAGICEAELELGKRLSRYKNDRDTRIAAGRWLSSAAAKGSSEAKALLESIADRAFDWPPATVIRQDEILGNIRDSFPLIAARLELAARFGLSAREMFFVEPETIDRGWSIEIDLYRHFKRMPWRLILIETEEQRQVITRVWAAFVSTDGSSVDLTAASTMGRARQLNAICARLGVDPSLFVYSWKA